MARTLCRIIILFVLAVLLAAPWSAADAPRVTGEPSLRLFSATWNWLSALWKETGCIIDPNGLCGSAPENLDTGCGVDPNGLCRSAPEPLETGCGIDPDGGCRDSSEGGEPSQRDIGCGLDPSGVCGQ